MQSGLEDVAVGVIAADGVLRAVARMPIRPVELDHAAPSSRDAERRPSTPRDPVVTSDALASWAASYAAPSWSATLDGTTRSPRGEFLASAAEEVCGKCRGLACVLSHSTIPHRTISSLPSDNSRGRPPLGGRRGALPPHSGRRGRRLARGDLAPSETAAWLELCVVHDCRRLPFRVLATVRRRPGPAVPCSDAMLAERPCT